MSDDGKPAWEQRHPEDLRDEALDGTFPRDPVFPPATAVRRIIVEPLEPISLAQRLRAAPQHRQGKAPQIMPTSLFGVRAQQHENRIEVKASCSGVASEALRLCDPLHTL